MRAIASLSLFLSRCMNACDCMFAQVSVSMSMSRSMTVCMHACDCMFAQVSLGGAVSAVAGGGSAGPGADMDRGDGVAMRREGIDGAVSLMRKALRMRNDNKVYVCVISCLL